MAKKDFSALAETIIEKVGGKNNIFQVAHCMTRLRINLKDRGLANLEEIKAVKGVLGVQWAADQLQIIIGPSVEQLYNELLPMLPNVEAAAPIQENLDKTEKKANPFSTAFTFISGCITPTLPVLVGSGLISAILALLTNFHVLSNESSTYVLLNTLANAAYNYLPVMVAFAGARRLKTNEYVAAFIMLALCSGAISGVAELTFLGLPLTTVKYTSNIVPALLMVPVMALLDRAVLKVTPEALKSTLRPFVLAMVMFPLTLLVLGPIGTLVGSALANFCVWITSFGGLSMAVLSALHPLLVMVGMHTVITPLIVNEISTVGSSLLFSKALAANLAIGGSALAVGLKAKKAENRQTGLSTGVTALLSVTEPALYGCLIRLKKPLISTMIASALTGIFIGIFDIRAYATASCSLLTLPIFMGGPMSNFYLACAAAVLAVILGFVVTWVIGFDED